MSQPKKKTVASPSSVVSDAEAKRALPRALMGGTLAMRAAGKAYLPQEMGESDTAYQARLSRTTLFNAYRKTVKDMAGKVFAKPVALDEDVKPDVAEWCENIDLAGRNLTQFAHAVFVDAVHSGVSYILAEMPPALPEAATRADEQAAGRRPYLCHIKAVDVLGWKSDLINGKETLTQFRISEYVSIPDPENEFEEKHIRQIRVLEPGKVRLFRQDKDDPEKWVQTEELPTSLTYIPLTAVYTNRVGYFLGEPVLMDLADLNVAHWQSQSDQRNILHVARVPILFGAGLDAPKQGEKAKVIAANAMFIATDPGARLEYVEHSGQAISAGRTDLRDLEMQMQAMGLQLLIAEPGQSATGEIRDDVKENSPLAMMAEALQDGLEEALNTCGEFAAMGEDAAGSLKVNTDFGISSRDATELQILLQALQAGAISHKTFLFECQRRGFLSETLEVEEEATAVLADRASGLMVDPTKPPEPADSLGKDGQDKKPGRPTARPASKPSKPPQKAALDA